MPRIFISYRREDSPGTVGRIVDRLNTRFGRENVFIDIDAIPLGVDFRDHIFGAVGQCDVFLAIIGRSWSGPRPDGGNRLDDANDFVRIEVETALTRAVPVIPVLIDKTSMPGESDLPASLRGLRYRNAIAVDHGLDFHGHVDRLIRGIMQLIPTEGVTAARQLRCRRILSTCAVFIAIMAALVLILAFARPPAAQDGASVLPGSRTPTERPRDVSRRQTESGATPVPSGTRKAMVNSIGMRLVLIPSGEFLMGSPASDREAEDDEKPPHPVSITSAFYMGACEVTQGQYRAVTGEDPSGNKGSDDLPVEMVSWDDAVGFCTRLNERERAELEGAVYRLPTEAEWEYACRSGSTTLYSFGDDLATLGQFAWYDENSAGASHRVGEKRASLFHLYDMHGNLWEWCEDWFDEHYYGVSPQQDPHGPRDAAYRVHRGGSWRDIPRDAQSANRNRSTRDFKDTNVGFRVVRSLPSR